MPKRKTTDLRNWAMRGAESRLREMAEEAAAIYRVFPDLRRKPGQPAETASPGAERQRRRKRRRMSAEGRKRISDAQKARWAGQKKAGK